MDGLRPAAIRHNTPLSSFSVNPQAIMAEPARIGADGCPEPQLRVLRERFEESTRNRILRERFP